MTESISTSPAAGDSLPPWMTSVSEKALYNADRSETGDDAPGEDAPEASAPDSAEPSQAAEPTASTPDFPLGQKLALSMEAAPDLPEPDPDLQPTAVGQVRRDLDRQLQKALSVLGTRYDEDVSRTLVLEFALHRTLRSLREEEEDSPLVQWLDSALSRS